MFRALLAHPEEDAALGILRVVQPTDITRMKYSYQLPLVKSLLQMSKQ
jgi:hypothetical protein